MARFIVVSSCGACSYEYKRHCKHSEAKNMYLMDEYYYGQIHPNCPLPTKEEIIDKASDC